MFTTRSMTVLNSAASASMSISLKSSEMSTFFTPSIFPISPTIRCAFEGSDREYT